MADRKKTPINSVNEEIISMEFDENPNIPTANYSEETAKRIEQAIIKKMRAEKLKRLIETELKNDKKIEDGESIGFEFSFKGM